MSQTISSDYLLSRHTEPTPRIISLSEVSSHDISTDCWIVVYDQVFDITSYIKKHPGGCDILLEYAGRDATNAFQSSGHSVSATKTLEIYHIGDLPLQERLFKDKRFRSPRR